MTPVQSLQRDLLAAGRSAVVARFPPDPWPDADAAWVVQVAPGAVRLMTAERNELRPYRDFPDEQAAADWLRERVLPAAPSTSSLTDQERQQQRAHAEAEKQRVWQRLHGRRPEGS